MHQDDHAILQHNALTLLSEQLKYWTVNAFPRTVFFSCCKNVLKTTFLASCSSPTQQWSPRERASRSVKSLVMPVLNSASRPGCRPRCLFVGATFRRSALWLSDSFLMACVVGAAVGGHVLHTLPCHCWTEQHSFRSDCALSQSSNRSTCLTYCTVYPTMLTPLI